MPVSQLVWLLMPGARHNTKGRAMSVMDQLTDRQKEVYEFIREKIRHRGYGPTVREIGGHFKISSPNGVMCHLKALEKKGLINREPNMSRAIMLSSDAPENKGLPMAGRIAAGMLHEAVEDNERVDFSEMFSPDSGDLFVLKVTGDSMIEDQIADGDYVVIRKQAQADNGEKVVAMVDGGMTLKKFYHKRGTVTLQPCNSAMDPIVVDPSKKNVQVLGVLVGVIRKC